MWILFQNWSGAFAQSSFNHGGSRLTFLDGVLSTKIINGGLSTVEKQPESNPTWEAQTSSVEEQAHGGSPLSETGESSQSSQNQLTPSEGGDQNNFVTRRGPIAKITH
ncbi:hypothetical protein E3N88_08807 [Mikania micrantha]|uniref:Uncharacterized protein n=1 Tax=Mikania micrantha TaxID=192012 RepID=A0A5N6PJ97_9ASTR|nr:hypothetical protein E3N88_08807 [Mikania micrantha]